MITRRHALSLLAAAPMAAGCSSNTLDPASAWRTAGAAQVDPLRQTLDAARD